jgi:hypothetical protein
LYVESIFSHCLAVLSVFLALVVTFCSYPKVAILKHLTVNIAQTMIEAQSLI